MIFPLSPAAKELLIFAVSAIGLVLPQLLFVAPVMQTEKVGVVPAFAQYTLEDFTMSVYQGDKLAWLIRANYAQNDSNKNWILKEVDGDYLSEKGSINIKSDEGSLDAANQTMSLDKNVFAVSENGYSFKTEHLDFFKAAEKKETYFTTEEHVDLFNVEEKLEVSAQGLKGAVNAGTVELLNRVRCHKNVPKYNDVHIRSDKAFIRSSLKSIRFYENLKITQDKMSLTGDEAYFVYNEGSGSLDSVRVKGDILASDGVKTAMSDKVEMRPAEDVIIFQGSPRIRMGKNEMVGEEILITNNQKNVQVRRGNIKSTRKGLDLEEEN